MKYQLSISPGYVNITVDTQLSGEYDTRLGILKTKDTHLLNLLNKVAKTKGVIVSPEDSPNGSELIVANGNKMTIKHYLLDKRQVRQLGYKVVGKIQRHYKLSKPEKAREWN